MVIFTALPTHEVRALQNGGEDAYGAPPERAVSDGAGNPCRHCLCLIPSGAPMLILAYRPFSGLHPYAETGPIFLCATSCARGGGRQLPEVLATSPDYLIKGYCRDDRIVYGTGAVVAPHQMAARAGEILGDPAIAYVHVRSARNNCYQARIDRGQRSDTARECGLAPGFGLAHKHGSHETRKGHPAMTIQAPETKIVESYRIACDGGEGGHPRVWLQISGEHGWVECPYCDCKFVHKDHQDKS